MKHNLHLPNHAKGRSTVKAFIYLVWGSLFALLLIWLLTRGENIPVTFFRNSRDTGMDFFNSICYTDGRVPYTAYSTLYPPLANLFFFSLRKMLPQSISVGDAPGMRQWQAPMLLFILFILLSALLSVAVYRRFYGSRCCNSHFPVACLLCFGNLYAFERGNIIVVALLLTVFFFTFYESKSRLLAELALISLALAAGLKIYPALFGLILVKERRRKQAGRAIAYGLACFVLPFFAFEGIEGMRIFFGQLVRMNTDPSALYGSIGISGIMMPVMKVIGKLTEIPLALQDVVTWTIKILAILILLASFFSSKKKWQQYLDLTLLLVLLQTSYYYTLSFFLIPFIAYCKEENSVEKANIAAFVFFMIVLLPYPAFTIHGVYETRYLLVIMAMAASVIGEAINVYKDLSHVLKPLQVQPRRNSER